MPEISPKAVFTQSNLNMYVCLLWRHLEGRRREARARARRLTVVGDRRAVRREHAAYLAM